MLETRPPAFVTRRHASNVWGKPNASIAASTPSPPVMSMICSTGSPWVKSTMSSAPNRLASACRSGRDSTAMIRPAPMRFAPMVAHSPTGPWANTATVVAELQVRRARRP